MQVKLGKRLVNPYPKLLTPPPTIALSSEGRSYIFTGDESKLNALFASAGAAHLLSPSNMQAEGVPHAAAVESEVEQASSFLTAAVARAEAAADRAALALQEAREVICDLQKMRLAAATLSAKELLSARFASPYIYDELARIPLSAELPSSLNAEENQYLDGIANLLGLSSRALALNAILLTQIHACPRIAASIRAKCPQLPYIVRSIPVAQSSDDLDDSSDNYSSDNFEDSSDNYSSDNYSSDNSEDDLFAALPPLDLADLDLSPPIVSTYSDITSDDDLYEELMYETAFSNAFLSKFRGDIPSLRESFSLLFSLIHYPHQTPASIYRKPWFNPDLIPLELREPFYELGNALLLPLKTQNVHEIQQLHDKFTSLLSGYPIDPTPSHFRAPEFMWLASQQLNSCIPI